MNPTALWRSSFKTNGYYHFPQLLSPDLIRVARNRIEQELATNYDPARQVEYENQSYCPGLRKSAEIMGLFHSAPVRDVLESLVNRKQMECDSGQIAIRRAHNVAQIEPPYPHIDGIPTPDNGMQEAEITPFSMLIGVFLSDVVTDFAGNFTVWPGSHVLIESYFRERGQSAVREGMPSIPLGAPKQLLSKIGDVVVCHYQLAHAAAVNTSDNDRYAIFFRLRHRELDPDNKAYARNRWEHLTDLWSGWKLPQ